MSAHTHANANHPETHATADDAARPEVKQPEAADHVAAEAQAAPTTTPASAEVAPAAPAPASVIVMPAVLKAAEENLANHLGAHIAPELTEGLELTLSSAPSHGATDMILSFSGAMVAANPALLGEQVTTALQQLPAITALELAKPPHADMKEGKLRVHMEGLSIEGYATLVQALAAGIEAPAPAAAASPEVPVAAEAAAAHPAGCACASCAPSQAPAPVNTLEAPATAIGKIADVPSLAATAGVARG